MERLSEFVAREGRGDERLWWGGLKAFVDGSLGSTTAWFYEPYVDNPYLDASSNGLSTLVEAFKEQPLFGHIWLDRSERSDLARPEIL